MTNDYELGSLELNLILKTKGKIKILYGKKSIDLLNPLGNLDYPDLTNKLSEIEARLSALEKK